MNEPITDPTILNLQTLTTFEKFEDNNNTDNRKNYRCFAHGLDPNNQYAQFSQSSLAQLGTTYQNKSVLLNHWDDTFGWGKTVSGEMGEDGLYVKMFIVPDIKIGSIDSNSIIKALDAGTIDYVSMGLRVLESVCTICGESFRTDCEHWRGREYRIERNGTTVTETCIEMIQKSEALELSLVGLGADRNARVVAKLEGLSSENKFQNDIYRFGYNSFTGVTNVNNQPTDKQEDDMSTELLLQERIDKLGAQVDASDAKLTIEKNQVAELNKQLTDLRGEASKYEQYVEGYNFFQGYLLDLFDKVYVAHKNGIDDDERDRKRKLMTKLAPEEFCDQLDTYQELAKERFKAGRQSLPDDKTKKESGAENVDPKVENRELKDSDLFYDDIDV